MSASAEQKFNFEKAQQLGSILKNKREELNISIGEVAERLKLTTKQIEYIENGEYESLPEPVFVRGFLRGYARFLNLDDSEITMQIDEVIPSLRKAASESMVRPGDKSINYQQQEVPKSFPKAIPFALAAVVLVSGILIWQNKTAESSDDNDVIASLEITEAQASVPNGNVLVIPMDSLEASGLAASDNVASDNAASDSAVTSNGLVVKVRYRSNLSVTDSEGKVIHSGIVAANSEHQFTDGKPPYDVRIGYGSGSTIQYGGEEVDLTNHFVDRKTIAVTVPQQ